MNIEYLFENASEKFPDKIAIIKGDKKISFGELQKQVSETAVYFSAKGIGKGDRVLVFVPMGIDLYRIVLALFKIGAVAVFLDEWVSKERLEICCRLAQCKGFIGIPKARLFAFFSSELRKIPVKLRLKGRIENSEMFLPVNCNENDTALITFTTGSTGIPKAADRTHGFLSEQFKALTDTIHPMATDI
ncbi:MAG: AMP-binding protein, partial [Bacteroidia bacterium]|nr:AMP-binding protein [Bacteroidia bacterium]